MEKYFTSKKYFIPGKYFPKRPRASQRPPTALWNQVLQREVQYHFITKTERLCQGRRIFGKSHSEERFLRVCSSSGKTLKIRKIQDP